jgi:hypothetical protein
MWGPSDWTILSGVVRARREAADRLRASLTQVSKFYQQVSTRDLESRQKIPGLGPKRAEIIVPGVAVLLLALIGRKEAGPGGLDEGADEVCVVRSSLLPSRLHAIARRARTLNAVDAARLSILAFSSALTVSPTRTKNFPMPCLFHRR